MESGSTYEAESARQEVGPEARLRRVEVWVEEREDTMAFVTNNLTSSARAIAAAYKERWRIELFFKAIKESLRLIWTTVVIRL